MPSQKTNKPAAAGSGNGNILSFFKPAVTQSQPKTPPRASSSSRLSALSSPSPLPSPSPLSRRSRSETATPAGRRQPQRQEIAASDDDGSEYGGSSSDGSLEDLSVLLGGGTRRAMPTQQKTPQDPYATPRAKRTAVEFHSSPLAIIPKHKFDFKALAKDARKDHATTASSLLSKQAAEESRQRAAASKAEPLGDVVAGVVKEKGGHDAQKVLRAVQRSDPGQAQLRYCFFEQESTAPSPKPVPREGKKGPWRLLTQGSVKTREQHLVSGVPQMVLHKLNDMPDSLFQWILDDLCTQQSIIIRQEYGDMLWDCREQIERLLTPERLQGLFLQLGAAEDIKNEEAEFPVSKLGHDPYQDRDWSCLQTFLELLSGICCHMSVPAAKFAAQTLLRMSMDRFLICSIDLLSAYEDAVQSLVEAIPGPSWDSFCFETGSYLCNGIKAQSIRADALLCLPVSNRKTHDLRRRLAVVFLFEDNTLGRHNAEDVVSIRTMIDLVSGTEFSISPKTDFAELKAKIILLDIAIDDGSVRVFDDREDEKRFNDEVDELAAKLREIWRKINDSGMRLARTEAKSVVEWVEQRLLYMVRTKRKAKKSVFDLPGESDAADLPRQQDYMRKFLQR
ncbi:60s ribosomal protein l37 protein [Purpureocillium lavendulum]|uniref:60s ribosomal protein l37 protein n=1 Tax=Purpureocillium lavendulum TaxID=1247861 RepID=A0AB34FZV2_9HYPO|nr:60s ribosomal protein l37 protein [Purpureocillium lavendulum]